MYIDLLHLYIAIWLLYSIISCHLTPLSWHLIIVVCVVRTFMVWSGSNIQIQNTVLLTIITLLCIRSPEHMHLLTVRLYPFDQHLTNFPTAQAQVTIIPLSISMSLGFLDSIYDIIQYLSFSVWLSVMSSRSTYVVTMAEFSSFS